MGRLARGVAAGVAGTAAMTAWQELAARLQGGGSENGGRDAPAADAWERAPAPAKVARLFAGWAGVELPAEQIPLWTNVMHWATGVGWGTLYGLATGDDAGGGALRRGAAFGTLVWGASYAQLVPLGIYEPPWKYPPDVLAWDLSYHLAYGTGTALGHRFVER